MNRFDRARRIAFATCSLALVGMLLAPGNLISPAAGQSYGNESEVSGSVAGRLSSRIDALERKLSELNGRIEGLEHRDAQLSQRLDKLSEDMDFRLSAIERRLGASPVVAATPAPAPAPASTPAPAAAVGTSDGNPPATAKLPPGVLGTLPVGGPRPAGGGQPGAQAAAAPPPTPVGPAPAATSSGYRLPEGSAPERYDHAVSLLRRSEFDEAEKALAAFITLYPDDPLTGNAQYWLAESFYVRGQYEKAAGGFLECYTKYPKSSKAPDSLLKLGMTLNQLGQKKEACATFDQLKRELPNASEGVKQLALTEAKRAGCR